MKQELHDLFDAALKDTKSNLTFDKQAVATYAAQRMAFLASIVGEPGYEKAAIAERDNVLAEMGITATASADAAQSRLIGIVYGAMGLGARLSAGGAL